jgi:hypothetical protein
MKRRVSMLWVHDCSEKSVVAYCTIAAEVETETDVNCAGVIVGCGGQEFTDSVQRCEL